MPVSQQNRDIFISILGPRPNQSFENCQLEHEGAPRAMAGVRLLAAAAEKQKPAHVLFEHFGELLDYAPKM